VRTDARSPTSALEGGSWLELARSRGWNALVYAITELLIRLRNRLLEQRKPIPTHLPNSAVPDYLQK
jgi:hypothetical protein